MSLLLSPAFDGPDLVVSEVFGPTVQGEGPSCGRQAVFVRLADCNLACSWCDTPYSWKWAEYVRRKETYRCNAEEVLDRARSSGAGLVVITGGEPLLQKGLEPLIAALVDGGLDVEVETNGTRLPDPDLLLRARFNVSPKLANSGMPQRRRIHPGVLRALARSGSAVFKFVVEHPRGTGRGRGPGRAVPSGTGVDHAAGHFGRGGTHPPGSARRRGDRAGVEPVHPVAGAAVGWSAWPLSGPRGLGRAVFSPPGGHACWKVALSGGEAFLLPRWERL